MYNNELITMKTERIVSFFKSLDRMLDGIENMVKNHKPTLNGERYLTDREVSSRLKVSRRTLQDYRNEGRIPYYQLGGKVLYRESDIQRVLEEGYREVFR
jgi:excisionase family DNA binding protein